MNKENDLINHEYDWEIDGMVDRNDPVFPSYIIHIIDKEEYRIVLDFFDNNLSHTIDLYKNIFKNKIVSITKINSRQSTLGLFRSI